MSVPGLDCSSCVFFQPSFETDAVGQCRRRAPFTERTPQGPRTSWPRVTSSMWCGDHATLADPLDRQPGESDADYICRLLDAARDRT